MMRGQSRHGRQSERQYGGGGNDESRSQGRHESEGRRSEGRQSQHRQSESREGRGGERYRRLQY